MHQSPAEAARTYLEGVKRERARRTEFVLDVRPLVPPHKREKLRELVRAIQEEHPNPRRCLAEHRQRVEQQLEGVREAFEDAHLLPCGHQDALVERRDALAQLARGLAQHTA